MTTQTISPTVFAPAAFTLNMRGEHGMYFCCELAPFETHEAALDHAEQIHDAEWLASWEARHGRAWEFSFGYSDADLPPTRRGSGGNTGHLYIVELCISHDRYPTPRRECVTCTPRLAPIQGPARPPEHVAGCDPENTDPTRFVFCVACLDS